MHHSTVKVGDYLYMWGGDQPGLPEVHNSEEKKSISSVMEVCRLATGRWEQKPTTGRGMNQLLDTLNLGQF